MEIGSLIPMVGDGPNRFLIESLNYSNSQILTIQHRDFHKALGGKGDSEVFCFYETLQSPTAQQDKFGAWKMTGPDAILVTKSSAIHCRPWEDGAENICALNRTHSEMVKFKPNDSDYNIVKEKIKGLSRRALIARGLANDINNDKCNKFGHSANGPRCYKCGEFGHFANDLHCYKCGGYGHYANDVHCDKCGGIGHYANDPHCYKCHAYGHFAKECSMR
ncbi:hypothetical protein TRIATDRAFT_302109, partial [Trichoderma atroviride IMI 206040]